MKRRFLAFFMTLVVLVCIVLTPALAAPYYFLYENLDPLAQEAYDDLLANVGHIANGETFTITKTLTEREMNEYSEALKRAMQVIDHDHPELFYISWASSWNWNGSSAGGGRYKYKIKVSVQRRINWENGRPIDDDVWFLNELANQLAAEVDAAGPRRYDKLLYLHDWLTEHNYYNSPALEELNNNNITDYFPWTPISALDTARSPVCEGYSRAMQIVCQKLDIPCILVFGNAHGAHMWNAVQMEDGQWYAIDATWDDPLCGDYTIDHMLKSGAETHDYFLVGQSILMDHEPQWDRNYPELSYYAYDPNNAPWTDPDPEPAPPPPPEPTPDNPILGTAKAEFNTFIVDGVPVTFPTYNVSDFNYIQIRDLAYILMGTPAEYAVNWDGAAKSIDLIPHSYYTITGSELNPPFQGQNWQYSRPTSTILVNGVPTSFDAILLSNKGNGYTYFKIRDLANALGFTIDWDPVTGIISVDTGLYTEPEPEPEPEPDPYTYIPVHTDGIGYSHRYFSVTLPDWWRENVIVNTYDWDVSFSISFNHLQSYLDGWGGHLFTIAAFESFEDYCDIPSCDVLGFIYDENGYYAWTLVAIYPTDVQFPEYCADDYSAYYDDFQSLINTITAVDGCRFEPYW